jgi:PAS domain S-box-containing protein
VQPETSWASYAQAAPGRHAIELQKHEASGEISAILPLNYEILRQNSVTRLTVPVRTFTESMRLGKPAMAPHVSPSGRETFFAASELIVSKTDLRGRITYANGLFCKMAGYRESELIGQPHSIIRYPDMPRSVFRLLWDTIEDRREIFAFVKNMARNGDHYWVFAHVTPSFDAKGAMTGYHSNRRVPDRRMLEAAIIPLYAEVLKIQRGHVNGKDAVAAGYKALTDFVASQKVAYEELMFSHQSAA